jgi:outer membrane protein OmpA-like peptidoglycan-associated protein
LFTALKEHCKKEAGVVDVTKIFSMGLAVFASGLFCVTEVGAQPNENEEFIRQEASTEEVKNMLLNSRRSLGIGNETRGLSRKSESLPPSSTQTTNEEQPMGDSPMYVSVRVLFAYDSDVLTREALTELDKLGEALASPEFSNDHWRIEGHTDASGSEAYNNALSERRAASVHRYLVSKYALDPRLFEAVGKGELELYDSSAPYSGINRRVRVQPIGAS